MFTNAPHVLLIEDDLIVQKVHSIMLKCLGCYVEIAGTGQQAVAQATDQCDLILMDLGLPDLSGYEVTTQIRQKLQKKTIPIIVLTAFIISEVKDKCLATGANGIFNKPLTKDNLKKILQDHLLNGG